MSDQSNPSLVGAHAQYAKGATVEAIGNATGSEEWKTSGESEKQAGLDNMKAASANRDPQQSGLGKAEEVAGKVVGCEGMEQEGAQSKQS
ncbi:hypothetical protein BDY17DRAFT_295644 [Neohortaea acidophila]|uniref:CsbD-like domain-containing protein n=1 Tax=Neohortaea acidophila TaxID=245834 RepID=A0A6A6PWA0_9PEZI|nr:uncharacterized protein BDY17DRAFT_295644 [Neohortaea acidophila]KAF2484448.1 hypothetical protein BDY17DRAFT_295644 [Neohortaea acidophila]